MTLEIIKIGDIAMFNSDVMTSLERLERVAIQNYISNMVNTVLQSPTKERKQIADEKVNHIVRCFSPLFSQGKGIEKPVRQLARMMAEYSLKNYPKQYQGN